MVKLMSIHIEKEMNFEYLDGYGGKESSESVNESNGDITMRFTSSPTLCIIDLHITNTRCH